MKKIALGLFTFLTLMLLPLASQAVIITFEGSANAQYSAPITRSGFIFGNPLGQEQHFHEIMSAGYGHIDNGTGVLLNDRDTEIFVRSSAGSQFSLANVDVADFGAVGLNIQGYLNGLVIGTITLNNLGTGYTTLNGASLGNVDKLIFNGIGGNGGFAIDNINLSPVPLPSAFLLFGPALAGLGLLRRRFII